MPLANERAGWCIALSLLCVVAVPNVALCQSGPAPRFEDKRPLPRDGANGGTRPSPQTDQQASPPSSPPPNSQSSQQSKGLSDTSVQQQLDSMRKEIETLRRLAGDSEATRRAAETEFNAQIDAIKQQAQATELKFQREVARWSVVEVELNRRLQDAQRQLAEAVRQAQLDSQRMTAVVEQAKEALTRSATVFEEGRRLLLEAQRLTEQGKPAERSQPAKRTQSEAARPKPLKGASETRPRSPGQDDGSTVANKNRKSPAIATAPSRDTPSRDARSRDEPSRDTASRDTSSRDKPSRDTASRDTSSRDRKTSSTAVEPSRPDKGRTSAQEDNRADRRPSAADASPKSGRGDGGRQISASDVLSGGL